MIYIVRSHVPIRVGILLIDIPFGVHILQYLKLAAVAITHHHDSYEGVVVSADSWDLQRSQQCRCSPAADCSEC